MCPGLLFVFGTQTLGDRGTAGHYLCLHKGIFCSSPGTGWCVPSLSWMLRSKKRAGFFQHDPLSGRQLFPLLSFAPWGAATCAMSPSYPASVPSSAQPSRMVQVSLSIFFLCLINLFFSFFSCWGREKRAREIPSFGAVGLGAALITTKYCKGKEICSISACF